MPKKRGGAKKAGVAGAGRSGAGRRARTEKRTTTLRIVVKVRRGMGLYVGSATYGEKTLITAPYTTEVGARIAALGAVQANLASDEVS